MHEQSGHIDNTIFFYVSNARIDNNGDFRSTNFDQVQRNYQQVGASSVHHNKELSQGPQFDNLAQVIQYNYQCYCQETIVCILKVVI